MNELQKIAIKNSLATTFYVFLVAAFMSYGEEAKFGRINTILIPVTMLLLFVLSAAITSFLIFGKPAQMYVDGKRKEALTLLGYTLASFGAITVIAVVLLITISSLSNTY